MVTMSSVCLPTWPLTIQSGLVFVIGTLLETGGLHELKWLLSAHNTVVHVVPFLLALTNWTYNTRTTTMHALMSVGIFKIYEVSLYGVYGLKVGDVYGEVFETWIDRIMGTIFVLIAARDIFIFRQLRVSDPTSESV